MKKILNFTSLLFIINIFGQELNTDYLELRTKLLKAKKEIVVEFNTKCIGEIILDFEGGENCGKPYYLFWSKNDQYFKRKFSDCKIFPKIKMDNSKFINTIKNNLSEIKKSEILPVIHKMKNSKGEEETIQSEIDHYCKSKFVIHSQNEKIIKTVNEFYLREKMIYKNVPNDNYEINQKSILNKIFKLAKLETK